MTTELSNGALTKYLEANCEITPFNYVIYYRGGNEHYDYVLEFADDVMFGIKMSDRQVYCVNVMHGEQFVIFYEHGNITEGGDDDRFVNFIKVSIRNHGTVKIYRY